MLLILVLFVNLVLLYHQLVHVFAHLLIPYIIIHVYYAIYQIVNYAKRPMFVLHVNHFSPLIATYV